MKTLFYATLPILIVFAGNKVSAQANTTLSNLATPTSINVDLLPNATSVHSLGSGTKSWNNIFAQSGYYLNGSRVIHCLGGTTITPNSNTFVGVNAGNINASTNGSFNAAVGYQAMLLNNSGSYNTANGAYSLFNNNSGSYNTAVGHATLYNNLDGGGNTATGEGALYGNTHGIFNSATGESALGSNITGGYNTAMGYAAIQSGNGSANSAFGVSSLQFCGGTYNVAMGNSSAYENRSGSYNTAIGSYALVNTTVSTFNTAIGFDAGSLRDNGSYNTFLGAYADIYGGPYTNVTSVGFDAQCSANNQVRLGNHSVTSIGGFANWSNVSDVRIKKNIKQNVPGLAFINKLQPITYNLDLEAADRITQLPARKDKDGQTLQPLQAESDAKKAKEQVVYTGFSAQDVEKAAKSLNYDFSGVDPAKNSKDLYGLRYSDFVVPLVKAVQELSEQNDTLKQRVQKLEAMMDLLSSHTNNKLQNVLSSASLEQNSPNPFNNTTTINYVLPQQYSSAKIIVTDKAGKTLKEMNVSGSGKGTLQIDASTLSSGAYQYSLIVNSTLVGTKQMLLAK